MPFSECSTTCTPWGTKFGTKVGMPMPRLTYWPSSSSSATRAASSSRVSAMGSGLLVAGALGAGLLAGRGRGCLGLAAGPGRAHLDLLALGAHDDDPVDEQAGKVHVLRAD